MALLTLIEDLTTFPINRQDLQDMWATATVSAITQDDLEDGLLLAQTATSFSDFPSSPEPGQLVHHALDNVVYCWHDVVDDTGVSLWLAWGPDKFEVPCIAFEPLPAGVPVDLVYDKWVALPTEAHQCPLGFNQSGIDNTLEMNNGPTFGGQTTPSGSWLSVAVDGIVIGRLESALSHPSDTTFVSINTGIWVSMDPLNVTSLVSGTAPAFPTFDPVGMSIRQVPQHGNAALNATEPVHFVKFQFAPRKFRAFGSTTPA